MRRSRLLAALLASAGVGTLAVCAVPASPDVPWYAPVALGCALTIGGGLFSWSLAFVLDVTRRLAKLERAMKDTGDL
jgi:hypothetical protein